MRKTKMKYLVILGVFICLELFTKIAAADTISYTFGSPETIKDVIVIYKNNNNIEYLYIRNASLKREVLSLSSYKDVKVTYSSDEEKRNLIENWKKQTSFAVLKRTFGLSVNIACFGIRYPLPKNVVYYIGGPEIVEGPDIYIGKDSSSASKVFFKEMESIDIQNGKTVHIKWKNSELSDGELLPSWKYDDRQGAPAVFYAMDMDTLSYIELPLKNIRTITMTDQSAK